MRMINRHWVVWFLLLTGCQTDSRQTTVESQLRRQESTIRDLRDQVTTTQQMLADQDRELSSLRDPKGLESQPGIIAAGKVSTVSFSEETQVAWGSVATLQLHRLTSGLTKTSDGPLQLNVVLQPLDDDGELVKVAGELTVHVSIVDGDGEIQKLANQSFSITESRRLWSRGLISSGFHVQLKLNSEASQIVQAADDLLVNATLKLGKDRVYRTSELLPTK